MYSLLHSVDTGMENVLTILHDGYIKGIKRYRGLVFPRRCAKQEESSVVEMRSRRYLLELQATGSIKEENSSWWIKTRLLLMNWKQLQDK